MENLAHDAFAGFGHPVADNSPAYIGITAAGRNIEAAKVPTFVTQYVEKPGIRLR